MGEKKEIFLFIRNLLSPFLMPHMSIQLQNKFQVIFSWEKVKTFCKESTRKKLLQRLKAANEIYVDPFKKIWITSQGLISLLFSIECILEYKSDFNTFLYKYLDFIIKEIFQVSLNKIINILFDEEQFNLPKLTSFDSQISVSNLESEKNSACPNEVNIPSSCSTPFDSQIDLSNLDSEKDSEYQNEFNLSSSCSTPFDSQIDISTLLSQNSPEFSNSFPPSNLSVSRKNFSNLESQRGSESLNELNLPSPCSTSFDSQIELQYSDSPELFDLYSLCFSPFNSQMDAQQEQNSLQSSQSILFHSQLNNQSLQARQTLSDQFSIRSFEKKRKRKLANDLSPKYRNTLTNSIAKHISTFLTNTNFPSLLSFLKYYLGNDANSSERLDLFNYLFNEKKLANSSKTFHLQEISKTKIIYISDFIFISLSKISILNQHLSLHFDSESTLRREVKRINNLMTETLSISIEKLHFKKEKISGRFKNIFLIALSICSRPLPETIPCIINLDGRPQRNGELVLQLSIDAFPFSLLSRNSIIPLLWIQEKETIETIRTHISPYIDTIFSDCIALQNELVFLSINYLTLIFRIFQ